MSTILLLSGPNLNLFGVREPEVYGDITLDELVGIAERTAEAAGHEIEHVQSNHEGALVDALHDARGRCAAVIINAGALSHYSYSLADAISTFDGPVVELHVSNTSAREAWRHESVLAGVATGTIQGFGADGYRLAVEAAVVALEGGA